MEAGVKKTALHGVHVDLGAKMAPFAGFSMPIQYAGIRQEHEAVRRAAGLFDVSHMGNFLVRGNGAAAFLQRLASNNVSRLRPGDAQYSALCLPSGCVIDDILIYAFEPETYMVVVNASNIDKDWAWFQEHRGSGVELENRSEEMAIVSLQGPKAAAIAAKFGDPALPVLPTYKCLRTTVSGISTWVGRTGYTGEDGFEFFPDSKDAAALWRTLSEAGKNEGIAPVGLGARDTLRLEAGYSLYGHELSDAINLLEAGLGWITDFDKGDFIGRDALLQVKREGLQRRMTGIEMEDLAIPREGCPVHWQGRAVGAVTSGTLSPTLGKGIALALIEGQAAERGTPLQVLIRGIPKAGKAVNRSFYRRPKVAA
jgi:aminomethyltransferase